MKDRREESGRGSWWTMAWRRRKGGVRGRRNGDIIASDIL